MPHIQCDHITPPNDRCPTVVRVRDWPGGLVYCRPHKPHRPKVTPALDPFGRITPEFLAELSVSAARAGLSLPEYIYRVMIAGSHYWAMKGSNIHVKD